VEKRRPGSRSRTQKKKKERACSSDSNALKGGEVVAQIKEKGESRCGNPARRIRRGKKKRKGKRLHRLSIQAEKKKGEKKVNAEKRSPGNGRPNDIFNQGGKREKGCAPCNF